MSEPTKTLQTLPDPEKGTLEPLAVQLSYKNDAKPEDLLSPTFGAAKEKEKEKDLTVATKEVAVAPKPKPAAKPKKKVSKWILWQLWFNTYRLVLISSP